mmetsp:Transcript_30800/g.67614  ORF Transcript_30800/g.67614 Transcript_30800/m.67614 type:complete len:477 (+) Transcript_30800:153-1583(+)
MARGRKGGRRRHGDADDDSKEEDSNNNSIHQHEESASLSHTSPKDLDFAERRELHRRAQAEKRRSKMKCHLCGQSGHVRRECPGILDDGRGESRHKNAKGDKNAKSKASTKGARNRGRKSSKKEESVELILPPGFHVWPEEATSSPPHVTAGTADTDQLFKYLDACCDGNATIDYLRTGRGKNKLSMKEAIEEYQSAINKTTSSSNYGGCIARCSMECGRPFRPDNAFPINSDAVWYVLGFDNAAEFDAEALCNAISSNSDRVVGVFADLDYSPKVADRKGMSIDDQLNRLRKTIDVAVAARNSCPIQIRTAPSPPAASKAGNVAEEEVDAESPYSRVIVDLGKILLDYVRLYPFLRVHLSCWSGRPEHLTALLEAFPDNVWIGFDASVTFAKASIMHECAFDLPLSKLLLETGSPGTIPSAVTKAHGREAFGHSGHLPFVAAAIAAKKKTEEFTAENVARAASENTTSLYFASKQ